MEGAAAPQQNPLQRWFQSLDELVIAFIEFFLALSCIIFWGLKILLKTVFYGGPNKKKSWIVKLMKLAVKVLKVLLQLQEEKAKKKAKKRSDKGT